MAVRRRGFSGCFHVASLIVLALLVASASAGNSTDDEIVVYCWKGGGWAGYGQSVWKIPNYLGAQVVKGSCQGTKSVDFYVAATNCRFSVPCTMTFDSASLAYADGVIMEGASFGANYEWRRKAPDFVEKRPWQKWVQLAYEQHYYFPFVLEPEFMSRQVRLLILLLRPALVAYAGCRTSI